MTRRPLRVGQALELLPDLTEMAPLRAALVAGSREDAERAWATSEAYLTADTRVADVAALERRLPELVEQARARLESVYGHAVRAVGAAERGDDAGAARALIAAGEAEEAAGRREEATAFFERALAVGRRPRDRRPEGTALLRLARVARAAGELDRSRRLYHQGHEVADAMRAAESLVVACQGLGNVAMDLGEWADAERWYLRGLEQAGEAPSRPRWQLESNLSAAARRRGDLAASARWMELARATVEALDDAPGRVYVLNVEGLLEMARGDAASAERVYLAALEVAETPEQRAYVLVNLAEARVARGALAAAERTARNAERVALAHRIAPLLPHVYRGLGAVARARGDEDGMVFYEEALGLCGAPGGSRLEFAVTQQEYGRFEAALGRPELARARMQEAIAAYGRIGARAEQARMEAELAALDAAARGPEPNEGA